MKRTISLLLSVVFIIIALSAALPAAGAEEAKAECVEYDPVDEALPSIGERSLPNAESADEGLAQTGEGKNAADYTYTIEPLLAPFNEYFFVRTDNPDPLSFRFADYSSVYSDGSDDSKPRIISALKDNSGNLGKFVDIKYDDEATGRVNGGYIFKNSNCDTDGGKVILQAKSSGWFIYQYTWKDTDVALTLPALMDGADYLIDTYAVRDSFFDNMDAVQDGFSDICLYSGSYIRGKLTKTDPYWLAAIAGHIDQSFYIYSPYVRSGSRSLFASAVYPYRYDSLGFPGMMAEISRRLDSSSSCSRDQSYHYLVNVTYNGVTRSYGGAGNNNGKGIDEENIIKYFTFEKNAPKLTLEGSYSLLLEYSKLNIDDDIPQDDALTFGSMCDTVGSGAWVRLSNSSLRTNGHWDLSNPTYTYLYSKDNVDYISDGEWGTGYRDYYGGKLGYFTDAWVDGRYIGEWRHIVPRATFEDHPDSDIFVINAKIPFVTYITTVKYDYEKQKYVYTYTVEDISIEEKNVLFRYNSSNDNWVVDRSIFDYDYADYSLMKLLIESGQLDAKYLDMLVLTRAQVEAMHVDKSTDRLPTMGYVFDGTQAPGTPFGFDYIIGDVDASDDVDITDATFIQRFSAGIETPFSDCELMRGDGDENGELDLPDATLIQYYITGIKTKFRIGERIS